MMGYSMAFASFHVIEVMSSPLFASKRIGYLAAAQSFSPTTDVLLLTTNQFKKDLTNGKLQDCSQALTCLAKLVTEDLGRDLEHDLSLLLNSPRPYIRKKALLVLYRLIMVHPDTLPVVSTRFRERLTDKDPGVTCAAVTVTCELARASPRSFLTLAPILYQLLTNKESNNWMLIKIVKLMGVLTPLEPRLGKKLVEPLTSLMRTTRAKSLLYECCSTVTSGLMAYPEAVELCAQRLGEFMDESDQNLKYLGLVSMRRLIQAHPHLALEHRDNILDCLDDADIGIRMRALELVSEFVTRRNVRDISRILLKKLQKASADGFSMEGAMAIGHAGVGVGSQPGHSSSADQEAPYRESLARQLLCTGEYKRSTDPSKAGYEMLKTGDDFAWYMTVVLGGLSELPLLSNMVRDVIGDQLLELTSRVEALRTISVKVALSLLQARTHPSESMSDGENSDSENVHSEEGNEVGTAATNGGNVPAVTATAKPAVGHRAEKDVHASALLSSSLVGSTAWILGEYSELIVDHFEAVKALVTFPQDALDAFALVRMLTACLKIYVSCPSTLVAKVGQEVSDYVNSFTDSQFAEVQERAWFFKAILGCTDEESRTDVEPLFEGKLIPVDYRAQAKIPVPNDLDLEKPLLDTESDSLLTFLLNRMGDTDDVHDGADEEESLFSEAVFANTTLSFSGVQTSSASSYSNQSTLVGSLPEVNKQRNPYYLETPAGAGPSRTLKEHEHDEPGSLYHYEGGQLSSEAAVVFSGEVPHGLSLSDEEGNAVTRSDLTVNERFEMAFEGAFDQPDAQNSAMEGKRKKKKKKRKEGRSKASATTAGGNEREIEAEVTLIDFDAPPSASPNPVGETVTTATPKHLADALLM